MRDWLINFLSTRAGTWLAPVMASAAAASATWIAKQVPFLAPYVTPDVCFFVALGAIMTLLHMATNLKALKYGKPLQNFLNVLGKPYGVQVDEDGVVGRVTLAGAKLVVGELIQDDAVPRNKLDIETRKALTVDPVAASQAVQRNMRGGKG